MYYSLAQGTHYKEYPSWTALSVAKFTVAAWVDNQAFQTATGGYVTRGTTGGNNEYQLGTIAANPSNQYRASFRGPDAVLYTAIYTTNFVLHQKDHVAMTVDGSNLILYVNGIARATTACTQTASSISTNLRIAVRSDGTNPADAYVGRAAVWGVALDAGDIEKLAAGTDPFRVRRSDLVMCDELNANSVDRIGGRGTYVGVSSFHQDPGKYRRGRLSGGIGQTVLPWLDRFNAGTGGSSAYTVPISETVTLSESIAVKYNAKPAPTDTVTLSAALAVSQGFKGVAPSDTVALSATLATIYNAKVTDSETVTYSEVLTNPAGSAYTVSVSETVTLSASLTVVYNAKATGLADTVSLSESIANKLGAHPTPGDTVALSETLFVSQAFKGVAPVDTVTLSATIANKLGAHPTLSDTVALSEALAAKYNAKVTPGDTVPLFEILTNPPSTNTGGFRFFLVP